VPPSRDVERPDGCTEAAREAAAGLAPGVMLRGRAAGGWPGCGWRAAGRAL
jgi:hypothetical protein